MLGKVIVAAIIGTVSFATGATTKPTTPAATADGVEYPEPIALKLRIPSVPLAGSSLGKPPMQAFGRQVWTNGKSPEQIDKLFRDLQHKPELRATYYTKNSLGGGEVVGFDVADGRVTSVTIYWRNLSQNQRQGFIQQLEAAAKTAPIILDASFDQAANALSVSVDDVKWLLAHHRPAPEIVAAMQNRKLIAGMTEREACAAMQHLTKRVTSETADGRTIDWGGWDFHAGRFNVSWSATIRDGKVVRADKAE